MRETVDAVLHLSGMIQQELAWALNTTQATVSRWLSGDRTPNIEAATRLELAAASEHVPFTAVDPSNRRGAVIIPDGVWTAAFAPRGSFRLPQSVHWSGTDTARVRDGGNPQHRIDMYRKVITNGRASDIVMWVDLVEFAATIDEGAWSYRHRDAWREALREKGLL